MRRISLLSKLFSQSICSDIPRERTIQVGNLSYSMRMLSVSLTCKARLKLILSSKATKIRFRRSTRDLAIRNTVLRCKGAKRRLVLDERFRCGVRLIPVSIHLTTSGLICIALSEISLSLSLNLRSLSVIRRGTCRSLRESRIVLRELSRLGTVTRISSLSRSSTRRSTSTLSTGISHSSRLGSTSSTRLSLSSLSNS